MVPLFKWQVCLLPETCESKVSASRRQAIEEVAKLTMDERFGCLGRENSWPKWPIPSDGLQMMVRFWPLLGQGMSNRRDSSQLEDFVHRRGNVYFCSGVSNSCARHIWTIAYDIKKREFVVKDIRLLIQHVFAGSFSGPLHSYTISSASIEACRRQQWRVSTTQMTHGQGRRHQHEIQTKRCIAAQQECLRFCQVLANVLTWRNLRELTEQTDYELV